MRSPEKPATYEWRLNFILVAQQGEVKTEVDILPCLRTERGSGWFEHPSRMLTEMFRIRQTSHKAGVILAMHLVSVSYLTVFVVRIQKISPTWSR